MRGILMPGDRELVVAEFPVPTAGPGEVVLEIKAAGLCGSDLHMHYRPTSKQRRGSMFGLRTDPDIVVGHEGAGVVAEVGRGVIDPRPGDRVAFHHMGGCGRCQACRRGWDVNCEQKWGTYGLDRPGAMEDYMVVRARDCVHVPVGVSLEDAAYYSCGAGTGYFALERAALGLGDTVTIVGLGPVGLAAGFFARRFGAIVVGVDPIEARRNFAVAQGAATTVCGSDSGGVLRRIEEESGKRGCDVVIETSGSSAGRRVALEAVGLFGRVCCVGFRDGQTPIDVERQIIQKQADVRGAWMFSLPALQGLLDGAERDNVSLSSLIVDRVPLSEAAEAWARFDAGGLGKSLIVWPG